MLALIEFEIGFVRVEAKD